MRTGSLNTASPGDETPSSYTYDPQDPVPTLGGNHSVIDGHIKDMIRAGAVDQRPNENRPDVLIYTSEPLEQDVEVTGPIRINLFASSSAVDTDFTAKLIDVYPDGTAYNLTEGILRARFRRSLYEPPVLLTPNEIDEFTIHLHPTSNVFLTGHRIRLHVTSSNFPLWDRNPNTGHPQGMDAEIRVAHQTIYHDRNHPSHVVLPIIPRR
jgi:putative CocE/NonD family hydrolase